MGNTDKEKAEQDMKKFLKIHGKTLKKYIEQYGEENFISKLEELFNKDKNENK